MPPAAPPLLLLLVPLILGTGCQASPEAPPIPAGDEGLPTPVWLYRASQCGPEDPVAVPLSRARSADSGFRLPANLPPDRPEEGSAPSPRHVAVGLGRFRTGGYAVRLQDPPVTRSEEALVVHVGVQRPPPGSVVTQALTHPCGVLRLPAAMGAFPEIEIRYGDRSWTLPRSGGGAGSAAGA